VLPYSLTLTRQHHLTHLLPHIFSHPIVPAHSRPRARGPPKSTFLFPNPPPPTLPLPSKEYHGPLKPVDTNASREGSAPATPDGQATTPSPNKPKKSFNTTGESPAHEIECIARVTLTIGPISYPGTELWVGRFMERRAAPPRREKDMKRQSLAEASAARRARIGSTPIASPTPSTAVQRVPFGPQPPPRPSAPPAALPPRTNLVSPPKTWRSQRELTDVPAAEFDPTSQRRCNATPMAIRDHPQSRSKQCNQRRASQAWSGSSSTRSRGRRRRGTGRRDGNPFDSFSTSSSRAGIDLCCGIGC